MLEPNSMQALGVAVELSPNSVSACIEQTRLGFMYAPYYHPVMKSVKSVRSALQVGQTTHGWLYRLSWYKQYTYLSDGMCITWYA